MKTSSTRFSMTFLKRFLQAIVNPQLALALALGAPLAASAAGSGQTFATPEEAVAALVVASDTDDPKALHVIFGLAATTLENPDRVQGTNEMRAFALALHQTNWIVRVSDSRCVLIVGDNSWPFPVPLMKQDGRWFFDTAAGEEELLDRRIGRNELATLAVVRAYVEAQREYAAKDRDGDEVLEYAQRVDSSPGKKDGLYWPLDLDGETSPLGPLVAEAQVQGYGGKRKEKGAGPEPFNGYLFKVLTRQGRSAPGGKYDYIINGNMIGGFALVAWPAEYGQSGIMTFIVNQQGRVYERDLGAEAAKTAAAMKEHNPDKKWSVSVD